MRSLEEIAKIVGRNAAQGDIGAAEELGSFCQEFLDAGATKIIRAHLEAGLLFVPLDNRAESAILDRFDNPPASKYYGYRKAKKAFSKKGKRMSVAKTHKTETNYNEVEYRVSSFTRKSGLMVLIEQSEHGTVVAMKSYLTGHESKKFVPDCKILSVENLLMLCIGSFRGLVPETYKALSYEVGSVIGYIQWHKEFLDLPVDEIRSRLPKDLSQHRLPKDLSQQLLRWD